MITFSSGLGFMTPDEFLDEMSDELRELLYPSPKEESTEEGDFLLPDTVPEEIAFGDGTDDVFASLKLADDGGRVEENADIGGEGRLSELLLERFNYKYPYIDYTTLPKKLSVSRLYPEILDPSDEEAVILDGIDGEDERITKMGILPRFAAASDPTESARRGIATHLLFQFCDLERLRDLGARAELERLKAESYLSVEDAERVRIKEVEAFRESTLFAQMLGASRIWRELRFNTLLPASMLTSDEERREGLGDARVLVQGVIDCLYEDKEGNLHLVDYKTDRLTREERESPELAEKRLKDAHSLQLSYYSEAILRMFGKRPLTVEVYSLQLGRCVDVKI
jgi:ATP-dependent helicase/nuclease subunit A